MFFRKTESAPDADMSRNDALSEKSPEVKQGDINFMAAFHFAEEACKNITHLDRLKIEVFFDIQAVIDRCYESVFLKLEKGAKTREQYIDDERRALATLAPVLYKIAAADSRCPVEVEGEVRGKRETLFGNNKQNVGTFDRPAGMYGLVRKVAYEGLNAQSVVVLIYAPLEEPPVKKV